MNIMQILSIMLAMGVFGMAMFTATDNPKAFLDYHGLLVVLGGTLSAAAVSFQLNRLGSLLKVFWNRTILGKKVDYRNTIRSLIKVADAFQKESPDLKQIIKGQNDPFMTECFDVLLDGIGDADYAYGLMKRRNDAIYELYMHDANKFKALGKYPPAMGLLGAVTGMIALLGSLGKPGAEKHIGPAMSVALVATLYGIAFANFFVIPISENLIEAAKETRRKNLVIITGLRLISRGTNPIILAEELNSFLLPLDRLDWKKELKGAA
jgi:chemotaxis protein MotA